VYLFVNVIDLRGRPSWRATGNRESIKNDANNAAAADGYVTREISRMWTRRGQAVVHRGMQKLQVEREFMQIVRAQYMHRTGGKIPENGNSHRRGPVAVSHERFDERLFPGAVIDVNTIGFRSSHVHSDDDFL
jgi:hypothetical protein